MPMPRKTKIVCTLGPSSSSPEMIRKLIECGMNVVRLNFSHGTHESHQALIHLVRSIALEMETSVGILQDLQGPKIRTGQLPEEGITIEQDQEIVLCPASSPCQYGIPVEYDHLHEDLQPGDRILLADGIMELAVEQIHDQHVHCRVIVGGTVFSRKGVNLPMSNLRIPAMTDKDRADLEMGLNAGVDYVALSFVRSENDLNLIRDIMDRHDHKARLIAKLEKPQAIKNLDRIIEKVDGVMVARGDLGVEMPLEEVPVIQKQIISTARKAGKTVITATQMLKSMIDAPRPTRAEASDVANAIFDGTDAVMLSDETAAGNYPDKATQVLHRISMTTEPYVANHFSDTSASIGCSSIEWAVGRAATWLAKDIGAAAIVAYTSSGFTARSVARFRPSCPILGLTPNESTYHQLSLIWGVLPGLTESFENTDDMFEIARRWVIKHRIAQGGDRLVITAGVPLGIPGSTNLLRVLEV